MGLALGDLLEEPQEGDGGEEEARGVGGNGRGWDVGGRVAELVDFRALLLLLLRLLTRKWLGEMNGW